MADMFGALSGNRARLTLILIAALLLSCKIAAPAAPTFDDLPTIMNLTEDTRFVFIVNGTDADGNYPLIFSDDSEVKMPVFSMENLNDSDNNRRAVINFTPTESDVLDSNSNLSNFHLTIVMKDSTFATTAQDVFFNITNVNDPPNVSSFTPALLTVEENGSITFSFDNDTADPDLTHPGEDSIVNTWYSNGTNTSSNVSWTYSPGFCDSGSYNITLRVNDSYKNSTSISGTLTVTNLNRAPVHNATIENVTWQEDTNLISNFTLTGFFNDSDNAECSGSNKDNLTYGYTSYSVSDSLNSSKSVNVSIDQSTGNVSFYVEDDWYGIEVIAFYANDSYNITYSNNITLNVTNVNDAPVLSRINNQSLRMNISFTMQVNATDPDNDTIYFYTNSTLIWINLTTGVINLTPTEADIGYHMVNITINDSQLIDSVIINFSVSNNSWPVLDAIGDQYGTKATLFELNLTATDAEGDNLTFTSNSSIFTIAWHNETMSKISFTPAFSDVANHSIQFTVTDIAGGTDSEIITFYINDSNRAPVLNTSIGNITWKYDTNLTDNITLSDYFHDPDNDNLAYNVTGNINITIVINQTTSNVSFYPDKGWSGVEYIKFYANDTSYTVYSNNITLNVTPNNAPIFNVSIANISFKQGINLTDNITLSDYFHDPDNDNLAYNVTGNINITLVINQTTSNVSFYPDRTWSGVEYIRFYANDSQNITYSNNITVNVSPNNAPVIHNIYPYGGSDWATVYGWASAGDYPNGANVSADENSTETFRQNSTDSDGDTLTYRWLLNGSLLNTTQNLTYYLNFSRAGVMNLTVQVSDWLNTTSFYWNINITNVNRGPTFGTKEYTSHSDFSGGTLNNTNITAHPGNITLAQSGGAYLNGTYISPSISLGANADKLDLTYISWSQSLPAGTNITLKTRTASTSSGLSSASWSTAYSNSTRSSITSANNPFIQFMAALTTKDDSKTPVLKDIAINYEIDTPTLLEDYIYEDWIDLDNYFEDLDADDNITFTQSDTTYITLTIDQNDHTVRMSFTSNWYGSETFSFTVNDTYSSVSSNNITVTVSDVTDDTSTTTTVISSGGGGGGGGVSKRTQVREVSKYEYASLLSPGDISIIEPNKVMVPVILENTLDEPLKDIYLSASSEEGISLEFDTSFISEIDINDKKTVNIFATSIVRAEPYTLHISAEVITPSLNDSILVQINPLENMSTKVYAVEDILKAHPECLELNELVVSAKKAINNKEYEKANQLLDEASRSCRFILSKAEEGREIEEKPSPKSDVLVWIVLTMLVFAATLSWYLTIRHMKRRRKESRKRKKGGT
ncbi:hypothetical protein KY358_05045 [Candidatus Woesearchaeota archaeon]|nr:hypothetical protein [Candidatus Woesearchaeota archaeon]